MQQAPPQQGRKLKSLDVSQVPRSNWQRTKLAVQSILYWQYTVCAKSLPQELAVPVGHGKVGCEQHLLLRLPDLVSQLGQVGRVASGLWNTRWWTHTAAERVAAVLLIATKQG